MPSRFDSFACILLIHSGDEYIMAEFMTLNPYCSATTPTISVSTTERVTAKPPTRLSGILRNIDIFIVTSIKFKHI